MAVNEKDLNFVIDQLSEFGSFETKKMFGGVGFFKEQIMFALIGGGVFRLKADEHTKQDFEKEGMSDFRPGNKPGRSMPYWQVPETILTDKTKLKQWAQVAFDVAKKTKK